MNFLLDYKVDIKKGNDKLAKDMCIQFQLFNFSIEFHICNFLIRV